MEEDETVRKLTVDETLQARVQSLTATYKTARLSESEEEAVAKLILMLAVAEWKVAGREAAYTAPPIREAHTPLEV